MGGTEVRRSANAGYSPVASTVLKNGNQMEGVIGVEPDMIVRMIQSHLEPERRRIEEGTEWGG